MALGKPTVGVHVGGPTPTVSDWHLIALRFVNGRITKASEPRQGAEMSLRSNLVFNLTEPVQVPLVELAWFERVDAAVARPIVNPNFARVIPVHNETHPHCASEVTNGNRSGDVRWIEVESDPSPRTSGFAHHQRDLREE